MVKKAVASFLTALVVTGAASCGSGEAPPASAPVAEPIDGFSWQRFDGTTISVLAPEHSVTQAMRDVAADFESETGIRVQIDALAEDLYFDRMELALRAKRGVTDVFMLPMDSAAYAHWQADVLQPITPYIEDPNLTHDGYDLADFPEAFLEPAEFPPGDANAQLYGIPVSFETYIVFANKDHVDTYLGGEMPATMDDLTAAAQRIDEESGGEVVGAVMRGIRSDTIVDTIAGIVFNRWGSEETPLPYNVWFDGDWSKPRVTDPRVVAGLADYAGMMKAGPSNIQSMDWPEATLLFSQGRAAFYIDASLFGPGFEDEAKSNVAGNVLYAELPPPDAGGLSHSGHWMWGLGIPKNAANPEAAWYFVQWFSSKDVAARVGAYHGGAPRLSTWDDPKYTEGLEPQYVDTVESAMQRSRSTIVQKEGWKEFSIEIAATVQRIQSGQAPDEAAQALQQRFLELSQP